MPQYAHPSFLRCTVGEEVAIVLKFVFVLQGVADFEGGNATTGYNGEGFWGRVVRSEEPEILALGLGSYTSVTLNVLTDCGFCEKLESSISADGVTL